MIFVELTLIYTDLRHIKRDLKVQKPHYFVSVPRLLESIYEDAQKQFCQESADKQRVINWLLSMSDRYIQARRIANIHQTKYCHKGHSEGEFANDIRILAQYLVLA
ncbi:MAG: hypothetical protein AB3A66_10770 [Nodularia sp. CChRGM 3473]